MSAAKVGALLGLAAKYATAVRRWHPLQPSDAVLLDDAIGIDSLSAWNHAIDTTDNDQHIIMAVSRSVRASSKTVFTGRAKVPPAAGCIVPTHAAMTKRKNLTVRA